MTSTTATAIDSLLESERGLTFASFDESVAWDLGTQLRARAARDGLAVSIEIRQANGALLFQCALPGASADTNAWAERKSAVALRFGESSAIVGERYASMREYPIMATWIDTTVYAPVGGSLLIRVLGTSIAVATASVSGLPGNGDHEFLVDGFRDFLTGNSGSTAGSRQ